MTGILKLAKELGMQPTHVVYIFLLLLVLALGVMMFRRATGYFMQLHNQLIEDHKQARVTYQQSMEGCVNMSTRVITTNTEVHRQAIEVIRECTDEHRRGRISGSPPET